MFKFLWPYDKKVNMNVRLEYFNHRGLYLSRTKLETALHAAASMRADHYKRLK